MVVYFHVAAARACRIAHPDEEVTADMVRQHVAQRAQEQPLVTMIVLWMLFMDMAFMMEESCKGEVGESGDYGLFQAAVRLCTSLMCMTNAFNYLHTIAYGMRQLLMGSDRLRLLIKCFAFCAKTAWNKPLAGDLVVEMVVGMFR